MLPSANSVVFCTNAVGLCPTVLHFAQIYAIIHLKVGDNMFKYRFVCTDKETILFRVNQMIVNDLPCEKTIFGENIFKAGIHFQECGEIIKGFYLEESEEDDGRFRGAPIRICFFGKFVEDTGNLFFDVHIYPNIIELLFFVFAFVFACVYGGVAGFIVSSLVLFFFAKVYYDMMNDTYNILSRIFN